MSKRATKRKRNLESDDEDYMSDYKDMDEDDEDVYAADEEMEENAHNIETTDDDDDDHYKYLTVDYSIAVDDEKLLENTVKLNTDFSINRLLSKAHSETWLYRKICTSTPLIASRILTENLKVTDIQCVYMEPSVNDVTSFYIKSNAKKK